MGKASTRRRNRRKDYLGSLARKNPEKFRMEWGKRLESWFEEARQRAGLLADEAGYPIPSTFAIVDEALDELVGCGPEAVSLELDATIEALIHTSCRAVAGAVDHRLYRLSNTLSNRGQMEAGTHKPPR